jgi:hypothetical protein
MQWVPPICCEVPKVAPIALWFAFAWRFLSKLTSAPLQRESSIPFDLMVVYMVRIAARKNVGHDPFRTDFRHQAQVPITQLRRSSMQRRNPYVMIRILQFVTSARFT